MAYKTKEEERAQTIKWRTENPEKWQEIQNNYKKVAKEKREKRLADDPLYDRKANVKKYGITHNDYDDMYLNQDSKCACCGDEIKRIDKHTHIDHCHTTGKVRGILCKPCNIGIGEFKDSVDRLQKAIDYLTLSSISR
jgi:hypothetical protein